MKTLTTVLILSLLIALSLSIGIAPQPFCLSKPIYKQFPLVQQQVLSHDMDGSFSGYNLNIELSSINTFATVSKKFRQLDRKNQYFPSIISHYIEHKDNGVGNDSFILYKDATGSVHFSYGQIKSRGSLPELQTTGIITNEKNVKCYDAALFYDFGVAIIDCARINPNNQDQPLTNIFYYFDLPRHKVTKTIQNDIYVNFKSIKSRKLIKFTQAQTFYPYLVRAYYADGVKQNSDNTYLQVFGAIDPYDLQSFGVVDRTYLHQPKFAINDIVAYNGDLFVLDSYIGLYRITVTKNHYIQIIGKFQQPNMKKFDIYSDDLQQQLIIALANSHTVYQINWIHNSQQKVINKYTLISDSTVKDIKINDRFVIVQSKAQVQKDPKTQIQVDYTWIFTKGSRTYMNAYQIINHNSSQVEIDFDASLNNLYTADQSGLALYKIDQARLNLHFINESMIGKSQDILITASSTDPNSKQTVNCSIFMKVFFAGKQDLKIYETSLPMTQAYSANNPGTLKVPLDRRYLGPNITYQVDHLDSKQIPKFWIDQVNQTQYITNSTVKPHDITFFRTDVITQYGRQLLVYYFQDTKNHTYIQTCIHVSDQISCQVQKQYQHNSRIASFCTAEFYSENNWNYYYIMVLEGNKNQVVLIDYNRHKIITRIDYDGHQQAEVYEVASSNGYLYVLRKNVKTIDVYELSYCKENQKCKISFKIDIYTLKNLGVQYFSPQYIITDSEHPQVLFIKCLGSLIVLDVDNQHKITLLDQITSAATKDLYYRVAVNKYRMILTASPNIIQQYNLQQVYLKDSMTLMKNYPTYGYRIQPNADIQFSDREFLVYVNAFDPKFNVSVVLIYRSGYPASAVLYDVIYLDSLYSRPGFEIQVCGYKVDFLTIVAGNQFKVYRIFEQPTLNIINVNTNYTFNILAKNSMSTLQTDRINVTIVNNPPYFNTTQQFNLTTQNLKYQTHGNYTWDDRKWFQGHVINYQYQCHQCESNKSIKQPKIKLRQHIDDYKIFGIANNDFIQTNKGGIGVADDLLFFYHHNGSIREIINIPEPTFLETCLRVAAFETAEFVVTACQTLGRGVNLRMTSMSSFKPITSGQYETQAYYVKNLQVVHDVVMIMDQSTYPELTQHPGSVFLYRASVNPDTLEEFQLLEQITNQDLLAAHGWDWTTQEAILGNAFLTFSPLSDTFRLYITQIRNGFFIVDFTRHSWQNQIHILSINYINMHQSLKQSNFDMPTDAYFYGINFNSIISHPFMQLQNIIISTKGYHNFQMTIIYDNTSKVQSTLLHRVYYRYGFYQSYNQIRTISGYLAMGYILPSRYIQTTNYTRQYVVVYDTNDYQHQSDKGYSERYVLTAFPVYHREAAVFAFNRTYDHHSNGSRIGMIVSEPSRSNTTSVSLSKTLQVQVRKGFKGQKMNITAYNDFQRFNFTIKLIQNQFNDEDTYLFIIVLSIATVLTIIFVCYLCSISKHKKKSAPESRQSLITQTNSFINDSISRQSQYQPPKTTQIKTTMIKQQSGYISDQEQGTVTVVHNQQQQQQNQLNQQQTQQQNQIIEEKIDYKIQQKVQKLIQSIIQKKVQQKVQVLLAPKIQENNQEIKQEKIKENNIKNIKKLEQQALKQLQLEQQIVQINLQPEQIKLKNIQKPVQVIQVIVPANQQTKSIEQKLQAQPFILNQQIPKVEHEKQVEQVNEAPSEN